MAGESLFLTARYSTKRILHLLIYWVKYLSSVHWNKVRWHRLVVNWNGGDWCIAFLSAIPSVKWPNVWSRDIKDSILHPCRRQYQSDISVSERASSDYPQLMPVFGSGNSRTRQVLHKYSYTYAPTLCLLDRASSW
jgi:hypothetical protein